MMSPVVGSVRPSTKVIVGANHVGRKLIRVESLAMGERAFIILSKNPVIFLPKVSG
jgi:hypothetical protein